VNENLSSKRKRDVKTNHSINVHAAGISEKKRIIPHSALEPAVSWLSSAAALSVVVDVVDKVVDGVCGLGGTYTWLPNTKRPKKKHSEISLSCLWTRFGM
jgi:hypothetical protein